MGFPHILIFHLFLSNKRCLLPSLSSWGPSSCPAPVDTFPLTEMLLSHLALYFLLYLHYSTSVVLPHAWESVYPGFGSCDFLHKWSWLFSTCETPGCIVGVYSLSEASFSLGMRVSPSQSFLGSLYRLPRAPLSWHSGQKCFFLETIVKEKNTQGLQRTFKNIFFLDNTGTTQISQSLSTLPQGFCRFNLWLRQLYSFPLLCYSPVF